MPTGQGQRLSRQTSPQLQLAVRPAGFFETKRALEVRVVALRSATLCAVVSLSSHNLPGSVPVVPLISLNGSL